MSNKKTNKNSELSRACTTTSKQKTPKTQSKASAPKKVQSATSPKTNKSNPNANMHVGEMWRGETKYIDPEPKKQRHYVVVIDDGKHQTVSKVKSIKIFDENGKNADQALVEINATRYGLEQRSGVDRETFNKNRMSGKPLKLSDKDVFPEDKPRAKLGSHDKARVIRHSGKLKKKRDK